MRPAFARKLLGLVAAGWAVRCQVVTLACADRYNLQRFVDAQEKHRLYETVRNELQAGKKTNHWMWFIFPQISGLGRSDTAIFYSISSQEEDRNVHAAAYLDHPMLGPRLRECVGDILKLTGGKTAHGIFGKVDAAKLLSSLTLFDQVEPLTEFDRALCRYFDGKRDTRTLEILTDMANDSDR
eukprot:s3518_g3.t1